MWPQFIAIHKLKETCSMLAHIARFIFKKKLLLKLKTRFSCCREVQASVWGKINLNKHPKPFKIYNFPVRTRSLSLKQHCTHCPGQQESVIQDPLITYLHIKNILQARRQKFSEGGSFDTAGCLKPRSPWVFDAKSCNLAISRHFIQTFGKPCFPLLIFKDFHQILHQLGLW